MKTGKSSRELKWQFYNLIQKFDKKVENAKEVAEKILSIIKEHEEAEKADK